jgi:hypothetical protein
MSDMLDAAREEHSVSPALRHERLSPARRRSSFQRLAIKGASHFLGAYLLEA